MPKRKLKKKLRIPSFSFSPLFFLITGALLICLSLGWGYYEKNVLSFENFKASENISSANNQPKRLIIASQSIDLEIKEATIEGDNWEINPDGASHLSFSATPGERGNVIIYGHNKENLLGGILNLKNRDEIILTDNQGRNYNYRVYQTLTVDPFDVWVLNDEGEETLTLYTCTGIFDTKRFVVKAKAV